MRVGIVGFKGSGKSTVFNALTGVGAGRLRKVSRTRVGTVAVPDVRLEKLAEILELKEIRHPEISLIDFTPGRGARALNPKGFKQLMEVDALALVVGHFAGSSQQNQRSPESVVEEFESELKLTDLVAMEKWMSQLTKERAPREELELLTRCKAYLEVEGPLRSLALDVEEKSWLAGFRFLSEKPLMVVLNLGPGEAVRPMPKELRRYIKKHGLPVVPVCAKAEMELAGLGEVERAQRLKELRLAEPASERFLRCYFGQLMKLTTVLTYDQVQVRSWRVERGTTALQAVMEAHPGREHEIVGMELVRYDDLVKYGNENKASKAGRFKKPVEGYRVREGDILLPRWSEGSTG